MPKQKIQLDEIDAESQTQVRARLDPDVIDEYAHLMRKGVIFPPIVVFSPPWSNRYVLADGFHRYHACRDKTTRKSIECEVIEGTPEDAIKYAIGANAEHGLRRTNADKRRAVEVALQHPDYQGMTTRELAEICRVSHNFVADVKRGPSSDDKKEKKPEKEPAEGNERPTKEPPSKAQQDKEDLMAAIYTIRSMPYSGSEAVDKLDFEPEDVVAMERAADWLDEALSV